MEKACATARSECNMDGAAIVSMQNATSRILRRTCIPSTTNKGRKHGQARWRRKRRGRAATNITNDSVTDRQCPCLLDLPDEILATIMRWTLPRDPKAVGEAVASLQGCCTRFDALCRMTCLEVTDMDLRFAPFACCDTDEYDPAIASSSGRLASAVGLVRAPRLRRQFMQTCVRYAIYSLIASKPDAMAPRLDLVPFSSFVRPESAAHLMARALAPVCGIFVYNYIKVYTHSDGHIDVRACCGTTAKILGPEPTVLDGWARDTINGALVAAATRAMNATDPLCKHKIVVDSIDLFEAYPDCAGHFCATRPGFTCPVGQNRNLTMKCTLDISSAVYPARREATCDPVSLSHRPPA
ncbi:hypothetical protein TW95_gp0628 [Pandoravirus inopinatum]|uniref:F-box domain protein n=1 Tax=Pandoravirus inopinatum TaxID=1605721 RepID=A0A0B5JCK0_9VIRU|nr:hypothetical protein TW95_gp0628 [Pandoravirus inopinatum]AJF97362.1 hypothetical protein [Pandoravirus inopinatum]